MKAIHAIIADWFTFDATRRWMNGSLAAPDPDPDFCQYCGTSPCQSLGREYGTHER